MIQFGHLVALTAWHPKDGVIVGLIVYWDAYNTGISLHLGWLFATVRWDW